MDAASAIMTTDTFPKGAWRRVKRRKREGATIVLTTHSMEEADALADRNAILVKAGQNEQVEYWTVQWQFQLRVCDATGTAIHSANKKKK